MSYSFRVKGTTKQDAITAAHVEFDKVLAAQPVHTHDLPTARETVEKFVGLLADDTTRDTTLDVSGSVWATADGLQQVSINIGVYFDAPRKE